MSNLPPWKATDASRKSFLEGGGEAGALMRAHDWASSPLGAPETWPEVLQVLVRLMLSSRQPMFLVWGAEQVTLYNDGYAEILASKHPAMGKAFHDILAEIWDDLAPIVARAYAGESIHMDDIPLTMHRKGYPEETHFSFSYTPVRHEDGTVAGFFCPCTETTEQVLEQRRALLRDRLNEQLRTLSGTPEVMEAASRILGEHVDVDQVAYAEIDEPADRAMIARDWNNGVIPSIAGCHQLSMFGTFWDDLRRGETVAIGDLATDPRTSAPDSREAFARLSIAGSLKVPMIKDGRLVALLCVNCAAPRVWTPAEIRLVEEVAERTWAAVEWTRSEAALRESEARFRGTFENAAVGIALIGPDGSLLRVNERLCAILGYTPEELRTKTFQDITHPDDLEADLADYQRILAGEIETYSLEKRYIQSDGEIVWAELTVGCARNENGSVNYFVSVVEDIGKRKLAEECLRESESKLAVVTAHAPVGIGLFDREGRWTFKNRILSELCGAFIPSRDPTMSAVWKAVNEAGQSVPPEDWPANRLIRGEAEAPDVYMCASNRGEVRWLRISAAPVPDSEYGVAIMEDVTAARRAEEQRALLMSEVNHRAKNILSVVQSIAMSTAGAEESEFVDKFQQRVQALSANQDLLVRSEWKGVDLQRLVRAQLAHFADLLDERITLSGPDVTVTTAASQSLGMVLHELATNAGKYGALTTPEGRVAIEWGVRQDDPATSLFTMRWRESGGPMVVAPARRGFGSTVTGDMARMNLQADVRLDYAPSGIVWELECPAGNCIDSAGDQRLNGARAAQPPTRCAARSRILVVEDEALVALAMARALQRAGHEVLGPTGSVAEALALMRDGCDAAVLDVNLGEETSEPIAEKLTNDQTPFLTVTGYDRSQLPPAFREAPLLTKPANLEAVTAEVGRCLGRAASFTR